MAGALTLPLSWAGEKSNTTFLIRAGPPLISTWMVVVGSVSSSEVIVMV
jgi:hypothetical protein